jgi:hypothetical protein
MTHEVHTTGASVMAIGPSQTLALWKGKRRAHLEYVPADSAQDASLADKMCTDEHFLLGYEQSGLAAQPNAAAMELLRWLLLH